MKRLSLIAPLLLIFACGEDEPRNSSPYEEGRYYEERIEPEVVHRDGGFDVGDALVGAAVMNMLTERRMPVSASGHEQPWRVGMGDGRQTRQQAVAAREARERRVVERSKRRATTPVETVVRPSGKRVLERSRAADQRKRTRVKTMTRNISKKRKRR